MPYISKEDRLFIDRALLANFNNEDIDNLETRGESYGMDSATIADLSRIIKGVPSGKVKGAFNYFVSRLFCHVFETHKAGYTQLSDAIAVLGDMQHEMRRRLLDPYEDKAIEKNGDLEEFNA